MRAAEARGATWKVYDGTVASFTLPVKNKTNERTQEIPPWGGGGPQSAPFLSRKRQYWTIIKWDANVPFSSIIKGKSFEVHQSAVWSDLVMQMLNGINYMEIFVPFCLSPLWSVVFWHKINLLLNIITRCLCSTQIWIHVFSIPILIVHMARRRKHNNIDWPKNPQCTSIWSFKMQTEEEKHDYI